MLNPQVLSSTTSIGIMFMASFLIWIMFAGLVVLWFIDGRIKKEQAFHALVTTLFAWGVASMIKALIPSERPFEALNFIPLTLTIPRDGSFPSEHASAAWALASTVWLHNKKIGSLFVFAAIGVSVGRILSGAHFPHDVIMGGIIGLSSAYLFERLHLFNVLSGKRK